MTFKKKIAAAFCLDDKGWLRHANFWSAWSRTTVASLPVLALWIRVWLGRVVSAAPYPGDPLGMGQSKILWPPALNR